MNKLPEPTIQYKFPYPDDSGYVEPNRWDVCGGVGWFIDTNELAAVMAHLRNSENLPRAIAASPDGTVWLALTSDTGGGGARQLTADLEPLSATTALNLPGGSATRGQTDRIAIDVEGDVMLVEHKDRLRGGMSPFLTIHAPDGRHHRCCPISRERASRVSRPTAGCRRERPSSISRWRSTQSISL